MFFQKLLTGTFTYYYANGKIRSKSIRIHGIIQAELHWGK